MTDLKHTDSAWFSKVTFFKLNKCGHRKVLSKRQMWMSIFHIINLKKKIMDTGFFNKKLILDYYFCLKSGPVFYFKFRMFILFRHVQTLFRIFSQCSESVQTLFRMFRHIQTMFRICSEFSVNVQNVQNLFRMFRLFRLCSVNVQNVQNFQSICFSCSIFYKLFGFPIL
jgi:hypothetical protein